LTDKTLESLFTALSSRLPINKSGFEGSPNSQRLTIRVIETAFYEIKEKNMTVVNALQKRRKWLTYADFWKRLFDFIAASMGLLIVAIPMVAIAILIWISSGFPILFIQDRVGKGGKIFHLVKFRTMTVQKTNTNTITDTITVAGDQRITRIGRYLRRWKLDELPQLWNVLVGDMSFVGPRPDVRGYADKLQGDSRRLLLLRPGITGPATLAYRHEEELLAQVADPVRYNDEVIYPDKVHINLEYLDHCSFFNDINYIWKTIFS
jgi:lipopolysaccharide/colanic/teichoic acid biosynthesis glycosyltransferase